MCESCGCARDHKVSGNRQQANLNKSLFAANRALARENRKHFDRRGLVVINMISSPGSGKTTLLEKTIEALGHTTRIGVIEGDIETERDAERIRAKGVPVVQLTTGGACHLDAAQVHRGLHLLEQEEGGQNIRLLFIENVGNLVCPAAFDLGEHQRMVAVSVPEGSDKPAKYPKAFATAQLLLISKTDLLPYFDFSMDEAQAEARRINPALEIIACSAVSGAGFDQWLDWLRRLDAQSSATGKNRKK
ncbi:MAG: hydrogenase accessory protein HypB [Desulfobulbaceae bacterium]|nr:MAG: hydrogenase accessory protein HypB [Desulfobulbaceae bacterium]